MLSQRPKALVLLERNEFALYAIHQELHGKAWAEGIELVPVLADVADRPRMEMVLRRHGITVLLHAAAYKHVPLVEATFARAWPTTSLEPALRSMRPWPAG